jgi:outer membrane protein TolC
MYTTESLWLRVFAFFLITSVTSFAIEFNDLMTRVLAQDPNLNAKIAAALYQSSLAKTETRWSSTEMAFGTVNLGQKEWELTASQGLELGDRPHRRGAIAKAEMKVNEAEKALRQAEIALLVNKEWNAIQHADRSSIVIDSQIHETLLLKDWQIKMVANGSLDPLDTLKTRVALEVLRQEMANWSNQRQAAILNLELLADTVFTENETFSNRQWPEPAKGFQIHSGQGNPRIAVSVTSLSITDAEMELQKLAILPELGISAGIAGGDSYDALLGVSVSIPLFTSNAVKNVAAQEKRNVAQAVHIAKVKEEQSNVQQIKNYLEILAEDYERMCQKLLPLEQQVLTITRLRYQQGVLPHSQLWMQIETVNRLELRKLELQAQFANAVAEITLFPETNK